MADSFRVARESRSASIGEGSEAVRGARPVLRAVDLPALLARDDGRGRIVALRELVKRWACDPEQRPQMIAQAPKRYRFYHTHPLNKTFSKKTFHPSLSPQSPEVNTSKKCDSVTEEDKTAGQRPFWRRAASPFCRALPRVAARSWARGPNQVTLTQASRLSPF